SRSVAADLTRAGRTESRSRVRWSMRALRRGRSFAGGVSFAPGGAGGGHRPHPAAWSPAPRGKSTRDPGAGDREVAAGGRRGGGASPAARGFPGDPFLPADRSLRRQAERADAGMMEFQVAPEQLA